MMGRLSDVRSVLPLIKRHVDFAKPLKVHVFEVVIRVVGGLLSGHSLLARARDVVPEYDDHLLHLATHLAKAMLPAFKTPSGLPWQFTNLKTVSASASTREGQGNGARCGHGDALAGGRCAGPRD